MSCSSTRATSNGGWSSNTHVRVENATGELEPVPAQSCTTLVEEGGSQLMTFSIDLPSEVYGPYQFAVPGLDDQAIEVIVP